MLNQRCRSPSRVWDSFLDCHWRFPDIPRSSRKSESWEDSDICLQSLPAAELKVWKLGLWYLFSSPFQQLTVLKRVPQILRLEPPSCHAHYKLRQMNHLSPSGTLNICFHWRQSLCKLPQSLDSQSWLSHYYSNSHYALQGSGYNWISAESQGCQMCKQPINWSTNCCLR